MVCLENSGEKLPCVLEGNKGPAPTLSKKKSKYNLLRYSDMSVFTLISWGVQVAFTVEPRDNSCWIIFREGLTY